VRRTVPLQEVLPMLPFDSLVHRLRLWATTAALLTAATPLQAQDSRLGSLVKQPLPQAEQALQILRYTRAHADVSPQQRWDFWWNAQDNDCVLVVAAQGSVVQVLNAPWSDCNLKGRALQRGDERARVVHAAAQSLGVEALEHRSHERDGKRFGDAASVAEFERGYRDGLNQLSDATRAKSKAYGSGREAGLNRRQRLAASGAFRGTGQAAAAAVVAPAAPVARSPAQMVGATDAELEVSMKAMGLKRVAFFMIKQEQFSRWGHAGGQTAPCFQAASEGGHVTSFMEVAEANCQ
jgi:hypothetical protein